MTKYLKIPDRLKKSGTSTNRFYMRECPQNKDLTRNPNNIIVAELFKSKNKEFPFILIYKETQPMMKDGFMAWYFTNLKELVQAKWIKMK